MSDISLSQPFYKSWRPVTVLFRHLDPARTTGITFVVILHLVFIYALVTTLVHRAVPLLPSAIQIRMLPQTKPDEQRLPPPPPKLRTLPPAFVPPPEIFIQPAPVVSPNKVIQANSEKTAPALPAPPPALAKQIRIEPDLDSAHSEEPEYPAMSRRMGEEGRVSLLVLVDPQGDVQQVRLERSSGYQRLDDAAIKAAKERSRFTPGSLDGKATSMWYRYRYDFHLN